MFNLKSSIKILNQNKKTCAHRWVKMKSINKSKEDFVQLLSHQSHLVSRSEMSIIDESK